MSYYISDDSTGSNITITGDVSYGGNLASFNIKKESGISPQLFFKYAKKKFGLLEDVRMKGRIQRLEKAFYNAVENGQDALSEKLINEVARETRESVLYAKGIRHFVERDDINKHKWNIKGGHISDTKFKDFTRVIPKDVLSKKKKYENVFDDFIIFHYWDEDSAKKAEKNEKMSKEEVSKMRDPILFGVIKETNRLYFIADWEDEFCDLKFEDIIDVIGKDDDEMTISKEPKLKI